MNIAVLVVN